MNWHDLKTNEQLEELISKSSVTPQVIFKYSSRCSISDMVKNRLERQYKSTDIEFHFLDLIRYRQLSSHIADHFGIRHESPQVLLIRDGKCVYDESHMAVTMGELVKNAMAA